ncbi:hypothetical protein [Pontibacter brevis]
MRLTFFVPIVVGLLLLALLYDYFEPVSVKQNPVTPTRLCWCSQHNSGQLSTYKK